LFSRLTMIFVALAVVALFGLLLVVFVPSLLRGIGSGPTATATHTVAGSPTIGPSPTVAPSPEASWQTYTIKLGDNLYQIAASFSLTYEQLLAANPQITNPDFIRAGDVLNIPPPNFVVPSPSGGGPTEEPSASP
jgi:LysM repeat protein